jgi:PAS domain S-box-containing protein
MNQALLLCRQGLALAGIDFNLDPSHDQIMDVYHACRQSLRDHPLESLAELHPAQCPTGKAALDLMLAAVPAALAGSSNLGKYLYCVAFDTSLRKGRGDSATWAYTFFAVILGSVFGEYQEAFRLGKLAYDLTQEEEQPWKARVSLVFGNVVNFWTQPMRTNIPYVRTAFQTAQKMGDLVAACYACIHLVSAMLGVGEKLEDIYAETDNGMQVILPTRYSGFTDILLGQQRLILALQGKTRQFFDYQADGFDEEAYAARIRTSQMPLTKFWYFTWQLQAHYLVGSLDKALAAAEAAAALLWTSPGHIEEALHKFYHALALAAACADRQDEQREGYLQQLRNYRDIFHNWAANCPENFASMRCLIEAELAGLMAQDLEAIRFYEKAIRLAHQNGFIQYEAISYELAANYYEKADMQTFSDHCRREAVRCYRAWGSLGKVQQMEARYPQCRSLGPRESLEPGSLDIDMQSVLRATQSISSEIVPDQLSQTLMRLLVETSGAERGFLILSRKGDQYVEAEAQTSQSGLSVQVLSSRPVAEFPGLPKTLLKYTERSLEKVLLLDAREPNPFDSDEVLQTRQLKSVLCLPLLRYGKLIGMVYLENKLVSHAFSPEKLSTLEILASQAAISIEHARLYADLSAEEEKLRAILEGMADGLMVCDNHGDITLINDAAIHIFGFPSRDAVTPSSRVQVVNQLDVRDAQGQRLSHEDLPLSRALRGETLIQDEYHIRQAQSGRLKTLRVSASPLRRVGGAIQGAVLVLRDVTELMELDLLKGEFLKSMAHELKTPLAVISGYFELFRILREKGDDQARLDTCVQRMEAGLQNLKSLVTALVDVSVFQVGKLKLNKTCFDVHALCLELISEAGTRSARHQLSMPRDKGLPLMIHADRLRIRQVLNNLLDNAIKYSPAGGQVEILLEEEAREIVVKVKDQGIGIPRDRQNRVFEWFYRAHAESEHDYGGMGVGLFMAEEIVQAHHGRIGFESELGSGSTFFFCLPKNGEQAA